MEITERLKLLAKVSRLCRLITTQTSDLIYSGENDFEETADLTRPLLMAYADELSLALPKTLTKVRVGDLKRHIHFLQMQDCEDIVIADVPDILEAVENFVVSDLTTTVQSEEIEVDAMQLIDRRFRPRLQRELSSEDPDYHALLVKCSIILGDVFKSRTGAVSHSDTEIGRIFKPDSPKLIVRQDTTGDTRRNFQRGAMLLMQGQLAFHRNTHAHEELDIPKISAVCALIFFTSLLRILESDESKITSNAASEAMPFG